MKNDFLRISTAEAVVNYVKSLIASGELVPGDTLPSERNLQADLQISRFALREGLARLNALGIINSSQGRATTVSTDLSPKSLNDVFLPLEAADHPRYVDDLFFSRALIETECASLAAVHRSDAQLEALQQITKLLAEAIDDSARYAELDYEFHHTIINASGNIFLAKIHALLHTQLKPAIAQSVDDMKHRQVSLAWHGKILNAIANQDAKAAKDAMTGHLGACQEAYHGYHDHLKPNSLASPVMTRL